ncbi:MAG TPA: EAL domain-containing protein [Thermoanaerobaculia bacterium]|nr:EAL domain-containing protein [Thermoanaerobaculia bacterium]
MQDPVAQAALDRALDDTEQLVLLYQPIHDARTGAVYAAEALLRQRRQSGELREASIIHEAAEESCDGELFTLDNILVKKAYTDAAQWQARHPEVRLHVNLSPRELQEGNVMQRLTALVTSCGIDTRRVNIEITETSYIDNPEETMDVLVGLQESGIRLWLDDFGTGHSALTHLQHFPVDGIKLPGAFIEPLPDDRRCRAIVAALIALAHDLGMAVVAEEVERQEQLDFLLEHGCEYIQGFLFSKPMETERFAALLDGR